MLRAKILLLLGSALLAALPVGCASSRQVGTGLAIGGAVLAAAGAVTTGVGLSCKQSADPNDAHAESCRDNPVTYTGLGTLGAGIFVGGIGLSVIEMSPPPRPKR